jgi:four helix bundle protein
MKKHNYKKLTIWLRAKELVKVVYLISEKFPDSERFGITSQMRRAIVSVVLNIVEGSGRNSSKDFAHFLNMAYTSLLEVECLMTLSIDLNFLKEVDTTEVQNEIEELLKMIYAFRDNLK